MTSTKSKYFANRGVARNKKPLKNLVYQITLSQLKPNEDKESYEKYKFKDLGYLVLKWHYETKNPIINFHGFITPIYLKELIGEKQYAKFCQGKREFIIQRRIDGKNIPTTAKTKND